MQDGHVYLADFGVSAPAEQRGSAEWAPRHTFVGTPCWCACVVACGRMASPLWRCFVRKRSSGSRACLCCAGAAHQT